jgi:hypothetical protein
LQNAETTQKTGHQGGKIRPRRPSGGASFLAGFSPGSGIDYYKIYATINYVEIPRMGMQLQITENFDKVSWFGRGPFENYEDRKYAAHVGFYSSTVDALNYTYIRPQETGYRTDVRWLALQNHCGFLVTGSLRSQPTFFKG